MSGVPSCRRAAAALLVAALAACSPAGGGAPPPPSRLTVALPQEPPSLNPLFLSGAATATLVPMIFSYLVTLDEHDRLQPDAAAVVPTRANGGVSADGKTIVYHLRRGLRWQDGAPLTAADVVFSYRAIVNPRNNVVSRSGYDRVAAVDALDPLTVRVRLREPYAPILSTFLAPNQNYGILPAHLLRDKPDLNQAAYNRDPIGSGPYRVAEWVRGDHLRLIRNESYYGGSPPIAEIDLKFVTDSNTILNQLRTGELDVDLVADPNHAAEYAAIRGERVVRAPLAGIGDLFFNVRDADVGDVRVRRALVASLDLSRIVREATRGAQTYAKAGRGLFSWGYDPAIGPPRYDPAAAAALFDAAGWRRGAGGARARDGRPLDVQFVFVTGNATAAALGLLLQQQLRTAGVALSLRAYNPTQFRAPAADGGPLYGGKFQLAFLEIYTPADPDTSWYFNCSEQAPNGFNTSRYCDPRTDRAETAGTSTYDPAQRRRSAADVQRLIAAALPEVPLWQENAVYVVPAALREFRPAAESPVWNVGRWTFAR